MMPDPATIEMSDEMSDENGPPAPLVVARGTAKSSSPRTSVGRLAAGLLRRRVETLFHHYPAALAGDEESIHQLRVAARRLRVALLLLADKPEGKRVRRSQRLLRDLARVAGTSRDLDVLLATYGAHLQGLPTRSPEQTRLRHRLGDGRRRGRARMVAGLLDLDIARLRRDLSTLVARPAPAPPVVVERFRVLCQHESTLLCEGFASLGAILDVQALHALRRRARRLRYAVEILGEVAGVEAGATKPWKSLQDRIGELHDHQVLSGWFLAQAALDEKKGHAALAAAARLESAWALHAVHKLHDELLVAAPIDMVKQGLARIGPLPVASHA